MSSSPVRRVSTGERINVDEPAGHLQSELKARGIRLTKQRRVVVQVMETASRHMDAGEILDVAEKQGQFVLFRQSCILLPHRA